MARKETQWMPFYTAEYIADTQHLTRAQHGSYLLLCFAYWRLGKALPDNDAMLAQITKCTSREWKAERPILAAFFVLKDGTWWHKRIEKELAEAAKRYDAKAKAGSKGAEKRWHSDSTANGTAMAQPIAEGRFCHDTGKGQEQRTDRKQKGEDFIKDLASSLSGQRRTSEWSPAEKKAAWQSKVLEWVQSHRPNAEYLAFYEGLLNDEEWALVKANQYDKLRKQRVA